MTDCTAQRDVAQSDAVWIPNYTPDSASEDMERAREDRPVTTPGIHRNSYAKPRPKRAGAHRLPTQRVVSPLYSYRDFTKLQLDASAGTDPGVPRS